MRAVDHTGGMPFESPYAHGFVRVAAAVPRVRVGDPAFNGARTVELARRAHEDHAALVIFPELGLAAYSSEDLFHQGALLDGVTGAIHEIVRPASPLRPVIVVGRAGPGRGRPVQRGGRHPSRPDPRRGPQELSSPSTTSTTRSASSAPRATSWATSCACSARASRSPRRWSSPAATCRGSCSTSRSARTCGRRSRPAPTHALAGATVLANLSAQQHHHRQGRLPAHALRGPVRARHRGLRLHRRRAGRVHHRHGLGRAGADLRERPAARTSHSDSPTSRS